MYNNENYVNSYIGKKFEKVHKKKFSLASFFFGSLHWAYRKMIIESIILVIIETIINVILSTLAFSIIFKSFPNLKNGFIIAISLCLIVSIVFRLLKGFLFPKIYIKHVNRKVEKILSNVNLTEPETILECQKKGGTSILVMILFIIIYSLCSSVTTKKLSIILETIDDLNSIYGSNFEDDNSNYELSEDTIMSDTSINIKDYLNIKIPKGFEKDTFFGDYCLNYENDIAEINIEALEKFCFNINNTTISDISDFENANLEKEYFAGRNWYFWQDKLIGIHYNYISKVNNKIIYIEWEFSETDEEDAEKLLDEILNSIEIDGKKGRKTNSVNNKKFDIEKYIKIELPDIFKEDKKTQNSISYKYNDDAIIKLTIYDKYEDAVEYVENFIEENDLEDTRYDAELDNLTWNILGSVLDDGVHYYNVAELSEKTLVYEYFISSDSDKADELNDIYQEIIFTIKNILDFE